MNNSVILQVDESTKGLMEEIQSGISSSIEDGMREVKDKVESVDGNTDMILRKFKNFDGLSSTVEQLKSLAEESKKFAAIVSPLESSVSEIKQDNKTQEITLGKVCSDIDLLSKAVVQLGENQNKLTSEVKTEILNVVTKLDNGGIKKALTDVLQKLSEADSARNDLSNNINSSLSDIKSSLEVAKKDINDCYNKLDEKIVNIANNQSNFSENFAQRENAHHEFEVNASSQIGELNKSVEKIQASLDIIINLVTPFWKKW